MLQATPDQQILGIRFKVTARGTQQQNLVVE